MKSKRINVEEQKVIVSLIKDHLRNTKLLDGLEELGFMSIDYYLALPDTILQLMGFKCESDFDFYYDLVEKAKFTGYDGHTLNVLAVEIYFEMCRLRDAE